ncbi:TPA: hypothetical protein ACRRX3_003683 [Morganella morganii]
MNNNKKNYITAKKGKSTDFSQQKIAPDVDNIKYIADLLAALYKNKK